MKERISETEDTKEETKITVKHSDTKRPKLQQMK